MAEKAKMHRDTHEVSPQSLGFDFYCVAHGSNRELSDLVPTTYCHDTDEDGYCHPDCPDCSQRCPWCARKGWEDA